MIDWTRVYKPGARHGAVGEGSAKFALKIDRWLDDETSHDQLIGANSVRAY